MMPKQPSDSQKLCDQSMIFITALHSSVPHVRLYNINMIQVVMSSVGSVYS